MSLLARTVVLAAALRSGTADLREVEVRRGLDAGDDLGPTLCSFANDRGGVIIVGLEASRGFAAVGVARAALARERLIAAVHFVEPSPPVHVESVVFEGVPVVVAVVGVLPAGDKPCHVLREGLLKGCYTRSGGNERRLSPYEVGTLLTGREQPRHDIEPVRDADFADLEPAAVRRLLDRTREQQRSRPAGASDGDVLKDLQVLVDDGGRLVPSLAGLLALGRHPQRFFPQLGVSVLLIPASQVPGQSAGAGGSAPTVHVVEGRTEVLVERTMMLLGGERIGASAEPGGPLARVAPESAREALVNAIVHRDYSPTACGTPVQVEVHEHGLTVRSPGGLSGTVTEDDLRPGGPSSIRNRRLSALLSYLGDGRAQPLVATSGRGVRIMVEGAERAGGGRPRFQVGLTSVVVALPARRDGGGLRPEEGGADHRTPTSSSSSAREMLSAGSPRRTAPAPAEPQGEARHLSGSEGRAAPGARDAPTRSWVPLAERTGEVRLLLEEHVELSAKEAAALLGTSERSVLVYLRAMVDVGEVRPTARARSPHRRYRLVQPLPGPGETT